MAASRMSVVSSSSVTRMGGKTAVSFSPLPLRSAAIGEFQEKARQWLPGVTPPQGNRRGEGDRMKRLLLCLLLAGCAQPPALTMEVNENLDIQDVEALSFGAITEADYAANVTAEDAAIGEVMRALGRTRE